MDRQNRINFERPSPEVKTGLGRGKESGVEKPLEKNLPDQKKLETVESPGESGGIGETAAKDRSEGEIISRRSTREVDKYIEMMGDEWKLNEEQKEILEEAISLVIRDGKDGYEKGKELLEKQLLKGKNKDSDSDSAYSALLDAFHDIISNNSKLKEIVGKDNGDN